MTTINEGNSNRNAFSVSTSSTSSMSSTGPVTTTGPLTSTGPLSPLNNRQPAMVGSTAVGITPKFVPTLSEDDAVVQARLLKALADPTRLRILSLLSRHEGEVCVFEIVESFTLEQPTISHHLRILRDAGLVDCRKKGLWAYYYVRRDALGRARDVIENLA
jgi:ArsR family transcriptional regulator